MYATACSRPVSDAPGPRRGSALTPAARPPRSTRARTPEPGWRFWMDLRGQPRAPALGQRVGYPVLQRRPVSVTVKAPAEPEELNSPTTLPTCYWSRPQEPSEPARTPPVFDAGRGACGQPRYARDLHRFPASARSPWSGSPVRPVDEEARNPGRPRVSALRGPARARLSLKHQRYRGEAPMADEGVPSRRLLDTLLDIRTVFAGPGT